MNRKENLVKGEYYHIYNRGVDKRDIFLDPFDLERFLDSMQIFNDVNPVGSIYEKKYELKKRIPKPFGGLTSKRLKNHKIMEELESKLIKEPKQKLVEIVAYCLNPNHFHFILAPLIDGGASEFMKRLGGGYTMYFNKKNERTGALFQGVFKSVLVGSNEQLLHLSAYVNLNNRFGKEKTPKLSLSSWGEYLGGRGICNTSIILKQFDNSQDYKTFALSALEIIKDKKDRDKADKMPSQKAFGGFTSKTSKSLPNRLQGKKF